MLDLKQSRSSLKIALMIDGPNFFASVKALKFDVDYKLLKRVWSTQGHLVRAYYYTAVDDESEYDAMRPVLDYLEYNGWCLKTKPMKVFTDSQGRKKIKGNMDIDIAVDAMNLAQYIDQLVLFTGDGDFRPLVEAVQNKGVTVTVVSTWKTKPSLVADELRRQADEFKDLEELMPSILRRY